MLLDRRLALVGVVLMIVLAGHLAPLLPLLPANLLGRTWQNALHLPAFAVLGYAIAAQYRNLAVWQSVGICLLVAAAFEGSQALTARDASFMDLAVDLLGVGLGTTAARRPGWNAWAAAMLVIVATLWMPARVWLAYLHRDGLFPVLLDPVAVLDSPLFASDSAVSVTSARDDPRGRPSLRVCWSGNRYPGIHFNEVVADWSGFGSLRLDLVVEGEGSMDLTVAIGHEGTPGTSAFVRQTFAPGAHEWHIPLARLIRDSSGAVAGISHLIVHSTPEYAGRCVRFGAIALSGPQRPD